MAANSACRLRHSNTRFQPRDDRKEVAPTVFLHLRGRLNRQPQPFVQILSHDFRKTKARRHHSNDRPRFAVDTDCLARDFAVGIECLPPQSFRKQHHLRAAGLSFVLSERPAQQRLNAKQLECIRRHARGNYAH